jgi:Holliday junction resolvase RusA-like endonuclease
MKNIYTIFTKTTEPNNLHYANANRFVHAYTAEGEEAMRAKVAELKQAGIEITDVYNRIGQKVKF